MYTFERIVTLFPELNSQQREAISKLGDLYIHWNERVNLISRRDMEHFYGRHVLHSLSIGFYFDLAGSRVIDVGTGGGFPGVPLAILFPSAEFTLVDSIKKKLNVVDEVCSELGIDNVSTRHSRIEDLKGKYDYLTGRAVKSLPQLYAWSNNLVDWKKGKESSGMLYLKGGEFSDELKMIPRRSVIFDLSERLTEDEFYSTKRLIHLF